MGAALKIRQAFRFNKTSNETEDGKRKENARLMLESDEDRTEKKSLPTGRAMVRRKVTTKKIDMEKKIVDVALRKERRAIRLFQYIERCEREEKMNKLAKLSAHVAKQRKLLEEQTIQLNTRMQTQKFEAQKKKSDALAEKRKLLLQIGRAKTDKSFGNDRGNTGEDKLAEAQEFHVFKSKFYDEQAQEMKAVRSKIKEHQQQCREKRAELFQKFSAKKSDVEEPLQVQQNQNRGPDMENELDRIIKKYTRPDSPVNLMSKAQKNLSPTEVLLKAKADASKRMQDNLKKNKMRTKQLTDGIKNHFGIVSSISQNFAEATRHARTMEDPVWEINQPEVAEDPNFNREPIEFVLKSKKGPSSTMTVTRLGSVSLKSTLDSKKSQAFIGMDVMESGPPAEELITTVEEDEANAKKKKLQENKILTAEEISLLQRTASIINEKSRFVKFRSKSYHLDKGKNRNNPNPTQTTVPGLPDGSTPQPDDEGEEERADILPPDDETSIFSKFGGDRKKSIRVARKSIDRRSSITPTKRPEESRKSSFLDVTSQQKNHSRANSIASEDSISALGRHTEVSNELRPSAYRHISQTDMQNPFSRNLQLFKPDDHVEAPLQEWLQQVKERKPTRKATRAEEWPAISLGAVAEFGKTIYSKKLLSLANAAEDEAKIAKPKKNSNRVSRYPKKTMELDQYFTERFEKDAAKSSFAQMPVMGEKLRYWPTELRYSKDLDFGEEEEQEAS